VGFEEIGLIAVLTDNLLLNFSNTKQTKDISTCSVKFKLKPACEIEVRVQHCSIVYNRGNV